MKNKNNLKIFRENKNNTQEEMSNEIGVSKSYYKKIELGERNPSHNFIKKFKKAFPEADIEKLFFENTGKKIS